MPGAGRRPSSRRGGTALLLAAVALTTSPFLGGLLFGVPALVLGARARRRGEGGPRVTLALVIATVALAATVASVLFVLRSTAFQDYVDCLQASQGVGEAEEACQDRLRDDLSG